MTSRYFSIRIKVCGWDEPEEHLSSGLLTKNDLIHMSDVWSRFSGGSGAPGWTLEAAGFNLRTLHQTGAAVLHNEFVREGMRYPKMIWPTNVSKMAAVGGCCHAIDVFSYSHMYSPLGHHVHALSCWKHICAQHHG